MNYQFHNETPIVFNTMLTNRKNLDFGNFEIFGNFRICKQKNGLRVHIRCSSHSIFFKINKTNPFFKKLKLPDLIYFKIHSWLSFAIELGLEGSGAIFLRQIKMQGTLTYLLWRFERHKIKTVPIRIWSMFPWDILFKSKALGRSCQTNLMKIGLIMINSR